MATEGKPTAGGPLGDESNAPGVAVAQATVNPPSHTPGARTPLSVDVDGLLRAKSPDIEDLLREIVLELKLNRVLQTIWANYEMDTDIDLETLINMLTNEREEQ